MDAEKLQELHDRYCRCAPEYKKMSYTTDPECPWCNGHPMGDDIVELTDKLAEAERKLAVAVEDIEGALYGVETGLETHPKIVNILTKALAEIRELIK